MATVTDHPIGSCDLVNVRTVTLQDDSSRHMYTGVVCLPGQGLLLVDFYKNNVVLYNRQTGDILARSEAQSLAWGVCSIDENRSQVAVTLRNGKIQIMSILATGPSPYIRSLKVLQSPFESGRGVSALPKQGKLVVSGVHRSKQCWCVMSISGEQVGTVHEICEFAGFGYSYLATSENEKYVYISCFADKLCDTGVYGYIVDSEERLFIYRHGNLSWPRGICADKRGFIYVCNQHHQNNSRSIYQLPEDGESATIFRLEIPPDPQAICLDENQENIFFTIWGRNEISSLRLMWRDHTGSVISAKAKTKTDREDGKEKTHMVLGGTNAGEQPIVPKKELVESWKQVNRVPPLRQGTKDAPGTAVDPMELSEVSLSGNKYEPATKRSKIESSLAGGDTEKGHVMISYDWGQQEKALWIKDQLETNGYIVWMDVEMMGQVLLRGNAEAVENAHVVLVCMSHKYNRSPNCEKEATYAHDKGKIMIPLKMEEDIVSDSWLGLLTAGHRLFDFSGKGPFGVKMRDLLRELARCYGRKFEEPRIVPFPSKDINPVIPAEILRMDDKSLQLYKRALQDGKEKIYNIRVMVVGQYGVGKTTLTKRLIGQQVNFSERKSTEGIAVHKHCCKISLGTKKWIVQPEDSDQLFRLERLRKLLSGPDQKPDVSQAQEGNMEVIYQRETTSEVDTTNNSGKSGSSGSDQQVQLTSSQPAQLSVIKVDERCVDHSDQKTSNLAVPVSEAKTSESEKKKDAVMKIFHLINKNADKLEKDIVKYATLSMWDFAGQYAFYTTHQTFLTSRAVYLLVIDLNQQVTDLINDDQCFIDTDGLKLCKVYDLVEIWLNSIHTCAPSSETIIPVILVGTHVDKLSEKSRKEVIGEYFKKLRYMLREKPTIHHLMDDIAIDNTQLDPMLEELKRRIFELSSRQFHWGEEKPARWLPLEQAIMTLKSSGVKVVPLSLVEDINSSGSVRIEDRNELELFLRFHHEMGTILYFSVEGLREKIVLDPQWMIDAQKSLITADTFIKTNPGITCKWYEFRETGKLTHELIDTIWTKENNPEFHDNKEHILLLMEQLNIIARPRLYIEDGEEPKEENYFLAPCMLQQKTPVEVICPKPNDQMESSSVLCYVFVGKFLPTPIFHRLLAACVAHWPIATKKKETTQERLIFCGCCVFQLDQHHKLTLHFKEYVVFVRVTRIGIREKTPSSMLCIEVKEFITTTLLKIIGYLGQSLKFEYFIQCPEYIGDSINSLIPVSRLKENAEVHCDFHDNIIESCTLLKFWFEDQEQSGDGDHSSAGPMSSPPTSDTDRFMCIAYLLNDVGSKVLRKLFHHMVTHTYTLDQYLANNRSIIDSLFKKKVLNPSQMDIMFPPNGDDTNLDDYDITLLSALFNNIVSTLGQQEKNLIKSLREDRNKLYGHTKSCKMNASDFQTCWSNISSTLITLSQQCGDPNFENQILKEIQLTRVPDASYLSLLQAWFSRLERIEHRLESNETSTSET